MSFVPGDVGQKSILTDGAQVDHLSENTVGHGVRVKGITNPATYPVIDGDIGEVRIHTPPAFTGNGARTQVATLTLTAGTWEMKAVGSTSRVNVAVGGTFIDMCISTTPGNSTAGTIDGYDSVCGAINTTSGYGGAFIPSKVVSISSPTPYYLNLRTDHTAVNDMVASMTAIRIA